MGEMCFYKKIQEQEKQKVTWNQVFKTLEQKGLRQKGDVLNPKGVITSGGTLLQDNRHIIGKPEIST